jgi:hypothetical protein
MHGFTDPPARTPSLPTVWLVGLAVWLAPLLLEAIDPRLLDLGTDCPWVLRGMVAISRKAALVVAVGGTAALLLLGAYARNTRRRWPLAGLAVLLLLPLAARFLDRPARGGGTILAHYARTTGFDAVRLDEAIRSLVIRVGRKVGAQGRVAVVFREDQDDWPHFLSYALCPRLFYAYRGREPGTEELRAEGIRWVLDVRNASYRSNYAGAVLRRVGP